MSSPPSQYGVKVAEVQAATQQTEISERQYDPDGKGDFNALENIDFFQLYNLPKYNPSDESDLTGDSSMGAEFNYGGYVPIIIQNTAFFNQQDTDVDNGTKIKIILPWKVHEISDTVSVSYSRKGEGNFQWGEAISTGLAAMGFTEIAKMAIATYNAKDLNKSLDLDFILPLTNVFDDRSKNSNLKGFPGDVRTKLGCLQGLVYPRDFGFLYPPLLKVTFGGLYRGFKGFLREVSLRSSEDMVDIGGQMFPLIISGSLKFTNVFLYSWANKLENDTNFLRQFSLSKRPWVLFGEDPSKEITTIPAANNSGSSAATNPGGSESYNPKEIDKLMNRKGLKSTHLPDQATLNSLSAGMQSFIDNYINMDLTKFDVNVINNLAKGYSDISDKIDAGQLEPFNIGSDNTTVSLVNQIQDKIATIQDVSNYADLLQDLENGDLFDSIASLTRIIRSSGNVLGESLTAAINIYWAGGAILEELDSGIDFDNVSYFYGNLLELIDGIETISNKQSAMETVYANTLRAEKVLDTVNETNDYVLNTYSDIPEMAPVTSLSAASTILLQTEILKNMDDFTTTNASIYEKTHQLYLNGDIDSTTFNKIKDMHDLSSNIDVDYVGSLNEVLFNNLTIINGVIQ